MTTWLEDIRYVRLGSSDLDASVRFATEILGLELVRKDARRAYLRAGDGADHHVVYVKGGLENEALAFEVAKDTGMDAAVTQLSRAGFALREGTRAEADERHLKNLFVFSDPTGNKIELVEGLASGSVVKYARDAGITSFSHVGLRTTDAPRDERFWTQRLGARVSDWIGDAALLRIDEVHHKIALFPSGRPGVQHVNFQTKEHDDLMKSFYFLKDRGVRIVFGPGRHPTSGAKFLYFQGPDGIVYEYSTGVRLIEDESKYEPRHFPFAPSSFCMWGSKPDIPEFNAATHPVEPLLSATGTEAE